MFGTFYYIRNVWWRIYNSIVTYIVQVSTGVGTISLHYNLHVVTPSAYIEGNGEHHIGEGSTLNLVCVVENVSLRLTEAEDN